MSIASYSDLLTAVANTLHRSDLTSVIPDFVTLTDSVINNDLRHRTMETTTATTIASGVIAVPTNYIELKDAYVSSTSPYQNLDRKTAEWVYENYPFRSSDNLPKFIAREGSNFIFGPFPDSNYVVTLVFYNRFPALSSATNTVFTTYPGLWLYLSVSEAYDYLKDEKRSAYWRSKYQQLFNLVQKEDTDEFLSGSQPVVMTAG